jgi:hypothetical protein
MAARSPSDSQLQAQLTQHQQLLLSAGLNGTTEKARADLAEAICRGLNLQEFSKLVEHLQQPDDTTNLRVVMQRSRKDPAWIRKNIQRGSAVGNPFPIKSDDGKQIRTPAEATALFRPWLAEQLADPTSKQSKWIAEVQGLLAEGHRIELGCCAHADCHGHHLIEVLQEVRQMAHPTTSTAAQGESDVTVPADDDAGSTDHQLSGQPLLLPQHLKRLDHPTIQFLAHREALEPGRPTFLSIANQKVVCAFTEEGELQVWSLRTENPDDYDNISWDAPTPEPGKLSVKLWGVEKRLTATSDASIEWLTSTSKKRGTPRAGGFYYTSSQAFDIENGLTTMGAATARGLTELCLEWDDLPIEEQQQRLESLKDYGLDLTTNTSGGDSVHGHIHLDRLYSWEEVMPAWKLLTALMGSDVCVVSLARAMRLAGVFRPKRQGLSNEWFNSEQKLLHLAERQYTLLEVLEVLRKMAAVQGVKTDHIGTRWSEYRDAYCRRNQCDELPHGWKEPIEAFTASSEQALVWSRRRCGSEAGGEFDAPVEWLRDELPIGAVIRRAVDALIEKHGIPGAYELVATDGGKGGKLREGFEFNFHDHGADKWAGQSPWSTPRPTASGTSLQIFKENGAFFCWGTRRSGKLGNFAIHFCPYVSNPTNPSEEDLEYLQIYLNRLAGIKEEVVDSKVDREMVELQTEQLNRFDTARSRRLQLSQIFPPMLAGLLGDRADAFPVEHTALLAPFLPLMASCLGKKFRVKAKGGFTQPMVLWTALVGSASDLKSPVIAEFSKPLKQRDHEAMAKYELQMADWRSGPGTTPPPSYPALRLAGSDTTLEALSSLLNRKDVNGLLSCHDELTGYFGGLDAYRSSKGKDRPAWLSLYDGDELRVLRKGSEPILIRNTAVSVCGGIQPQMLHELLTSEKGGGFNSRDGFWTRFLWVAPNNPPALMNDLELSIRHQLLALVDLMSAFTSVEPIITGLNPDAWELFKQRADERTLEARECHSAKEGYLGKQRGRLLRLAGILWALDHCLNGNPINTIGDRGPITGEVMERACLLEQFFMDQYDSLMPMVGGSDIPSWVAQILALADTREDRKVTSRDLTQRKWAESGAEAKDKLTKLVTKFGKGRMLPTPRKDQTWWAAA